MPFEVSLNVNINNDAKILIPLSIIGKKECTGERLKALINYFQSYNTTILVADGLQKYNLDGNESEALKKGQKFIDNNDEALKDAIVINSVEKWNEHKDTIGVKLVRWKTWAVIKETELKIADKVIDDNSQEGSALLASMKEQAKTRLGDELSSINYQKEENKYLLTFSDFDYHVYPGLNKSQLKVCELFSDKFRLPKPLSPTFTNIEQTLGLFCEKKERKKCLPFAMRMLFQQMVMIMGSSEFSPQAKSTFLNEIGDWMTNLIHEMNGKFGRKESSDSNPPSSKAGPSSK
ncbi:MAG: hypothetical protein WBE18_02165 [Gammaproteobacteria bacterium]